jgi:hypothetical protein
MARERAQGKKRVPRRLEMNAFFVSFVLSTLVGMFVVVVFLSTARRARDLFFWPLKAGSK